MNMVRKPEHSNVTAARRINDKCKKFHAEGRWDSETREAHDSQSLTDIDY